MPLPGRVLPQPNHHGQNTAIAGQLVIPRCEMSLVVNMLKKDFFDTKFDIFFMLQVKF